MIFLAAALRKLHLTRARERPGTSPLSAGATFARTGARQIVETAQVLGISEHGTGVPHVHYNCRLECENRIFDDGPRTLALPTFLERFNQAA
ncbi:MAG: hypothetical protein V3S88_02120 [Alphaproteobacteria bacterium]